MINGKELFAWLYKVGTDKLLHVLFGLLIAQVLYVLLHIGCAKWESAVVAFLLATLVAGAKEAIDVKFGVPSWKDLLASEVGIVVGLLIMLFV